MTGSPLVSVIGGIYRELCIEPDANRLLGSGLRAAGMLASSGENVELHTLVDPDTEAEAQSVAASLGVSLNARPRSRLVSFRYETPLDPPIWEAPKSENPALDPLDASRVVAFGMVDASWSIRAEQVVLDPQHCDPAELLRDVTAESIAVVLNHGEALRLGGASAAASQLRNSGVEVMVVKEGVRGGSVFERGELAGKFGPVPTTVVKPIGSGDAFTAGFAQSWFRGAAALEACNTGSRWAAAHSQCAYPVLDQRILDELPKQTPYLPSGRVYLAGPFFTAAERRLLRAVVQAFRDVGGEVFSPLDEVGLGGDEVASGDLEGLEGCGSVLALLDGADAGTLYEVGYARHMGLPVVGFAECPTAHEWTMLRGTDCEVHSDLATALYRSIWAAGGAL